MAAKQTQFDYSAVYAITQIAAANQLNEEESLELLRHVDMETARGVHRNKNITVYKDDVEAYAPACIAFINMRREANSWINELMEDVKR